MPHKMALITNMIRAVNITPRVLGVNTQIAQRKRFKISEWTRNLYGTEKRRGIINYTQNIYYLFGAK
jgi:hypothetical protein